MKHTLIVIIVLILLVLGVVWFMGKGEPLEAPNNNDTSPITGEEMPLGGDMIDDTDMNPTPVPSGYNTPVTNTTAPVKEFTVNGQNFSFVPSTLTVNKGDNVKITFKNIGGFHDFVIDEFKVATNQIQSGEQQTVSFIADKTGTFEYYCSVGTHRAMGMKGTLVVK